MKKYFTAFAALLLLTISCAQQQKKEETVPSQSSQKEVVQVIYFHGKQRCATCNAIETKTKNLLESAFDENIKNGQLEFKIIDISDKKNEAIADKYEVTWSSLFIIKHRKGSESVDNITEFAFANARSNPENFRNGLRETIESALKN